MNNVVIIYYFVIIKNIIREGLKLVRILYYYEYFNIRNDIFDLF